MKENLLAVGGADEPKSAIANDPLDCSLHSYLDLREEGPAFSCRSKTKGGTEVTEESLLHCGATLPIANSFVKQQLSGDNSAGYLAVQGRRVCALAAKVCGKGCQLSAVSDRPRRDSRITGRDWRLKISNGVL